MKNTSLCYLFQFHKGTIRTKNSPYLSIFRLYFNSIKVQLEPGSQSSYYNQMSFQFHKGTIRTR